MLLPHQKKFVEICSELNRDTALRTVLAHVVCGGGKSVLPVIAAHLLIPYRGDAICWAAPRHNLRVQAEGNFIAPWLRNLLRHRLEIRAAVNDTDPLRDKIGYCTTYQAIVTAASQAAMTGAKSPHVELFERKRMILVLDEVQLIGLNSDSHNALKPLIAKASLVIIISGGLTRHDNKRVAELIYLQPDAKNRAYVNMNNNANQRVIEYTLQEATRDHQLIKIEFELRDTKASWDIVKPKTVINDKIDTFKGASKYKTSKALTTALSTEFFYSLLAEAAEFWQRRRLVNPRSQFIVACPNISAAKAACAWLQRRGINADVATSDDTKAQLVIERFRHIEKPHLDAICVVGMAYIGMDCPPADVLCCLTHYRSKEWIEQLLHRVTRFDREGLPWEQQFATIFAPKDRFFLAIMAEIKAAQKPFVDETVYPPPPPPPPGDPCQLRPVESTKTEASTHTLDNPVIEHEEHEEINDLLHDAGLVGALGIDSAKKLRDAIIARNNSPQSPQPSPPSPQPLPPSLDPNWGIDFTGLTSSQREKIKRKEMERLKRSGYKPHLPHTMDTVKARGRACNAMVGKPVKNMTELELDFVWKQRAVWFAAQP